MGQIFSNPLAVSKNLSDLSNPATARASLGLGTLATQNASAVSTDIAGSVVQADGSIPQLNGFSDGPKNGSALSVLYNFAGDSIYGHALRAGAAIFASANATAGQIAFALENATGEPGTTFPIAPGVTASFELTGLPVFATTGNRLTAEIAGSASATAQIQALGLSADGAVIVDNNNPVSLVGNRMTSIGSLSSGTNRVRWLITNTGASTFYVLHIGGVSGKYTRSSRLLKNLGALMYGALRFSQAAGIDREHTFETLGVKRWDYGAEATAESGSNAGSNFRVRRYSDAGVSLGDALTINRATGLVAAPSGLSAASLSITSGTITWPSYTVATLPSAAVAGQVAYASNGRTGGELAGAGTGCPVFSKGGKWLRFDLNTQVQA